MEPLLEIYKSNVGKRSLFSKIVDIDFYDGPTEAICQLVDSQQWVVCSLVFFDVSKGVRIFTMLAVSNEWVEDFNSTWNKRANNQIGRYNKIKEVVNLFYSNYSGKVFLFKSHWLSDSDYEVVEIPIECLEYFKDIEKVFEQSEESKSKWNFFLGNAK